MPHEIKIHSWPDQPIRKEEDIIRALLYVVGEDPSREGLRETPARVIKAWTEDWCCGYSVTDDEIKALLKTFEDGANGCDEMVIVKNIEFYSHCEHHMAPFFGVAHIGYIPRLRIVGLSKVARLLDVFSKRLQVQERLTNQVADALYEGLEATGAAVVIEARHMCMCSRGVNKQSSMTATLAMRGAFKDRPETRAEFMAAIR